MDNTHNFTGYATDYTLGRPAYANEFIDNLYSKYGFSKESIIADIGSGTGKLAKQLLDKGSFVYGVEPNDDMRNISIKELAQYNKYLAINGTATETSLKSNSVDFITSAQAFHWFNILEFKKESSRILRKDGMVFLIWNIRDMSSEINQQSFEIYSKYCPNFKGFGGGIKEHDVRIKQFFDDKYEYNEYDNPIYYGENKFISRNLSGSYSLKVGDMHYEEYLNALHNLFKKYSNKDILVMPNKTSVYFGKI
ncbi:MAG: class I SAM-dependent methyltransferase [Lachnospiraceae bacterium]|nr:class I SAM-dependent methyltransferase [Lachnospiraceae bacterium]